MIALLDANVLYPPGLRDLLMWLAVVLAYEPRWTEEIHAEWMRNVLKDRPEVTAAQLERTRRLMDQVNPKCLVRGYEARIPTLTLPDENDRHVLAAAAGAPGGGRRNMRKTISTALPAEVEARIPADTSCKQEEPEFSAASLISQTRPAEDETLQREYSLALLRSAGDIGDEAEQQETFTCLQAAIDADRLSDRKRFAGEP